MSQPLPAEVVELSRGVLSTHARTFSLAGRLLPDEVLQEAAVVYAFCRLADDLVDEAPDVTTAQTDIGRLRAELAGTAPRRRLVDAFVRICATRKIELRVAFALIDGVIGDLEPARVGNDAALLGYCYAVAGTVGEMMHGVLRVTDPIARMHAVELGMAMQLTNISRDVAEDARMGRVYLPASRLARQGVTQAQLIAGTANPQATRAVILELIELAERFYARADGGMRAIPFRARVAIMSAARMYRAIGLRIRAGHVDPMAQRAVVPPSAKAGWIAQAMVTAPFMPR